MPGISKHLQGMGDNIRTGQPVGAALTAARLNGIMNAIRALARGDNIRPGLGVFTRQVGDGIVLSTRPVRGGTSSASACPFDISIVTVAGPAYKATFRAGTINQLLPSNYLTGVTVPATGTRYLTLSCTANNGKITTAAFAADTTPPDAIAPYAGQPPVAFKLLMGVVIDLDAIKTWGCGHIQANATESFRLQKVSPTAGQLPYDVYYTWEFATLATP